VCQRWRQIISSSPLGLNLRLHCTHGTPVSKALSCWPTLPIVLLYGGISNLDPPAPEDDENIIAALKQSGRVNSISLTVTSSIVEKLSTISEPLLELEKLTLLSQDTMELSLPSTFRWGSRLHTLHSTRIAFPSFPQLLSPCHDLVDLHLYEIPSAGYFSPEAFVNALSGMTQLRSLTLHLLSFPRRRSYVGLPPPSGQRIVLPALTRLKYRGISKYLDNLAARIDASHLSDIDITFFSQPTMDALQLGRFIEQINVQTSLSQAEIETSDDAVSISFINSGTSTPPLRLQISCKPLDWQLSGMAQVCDQFSPFLFRVEELRINTTRSPSGQDDEAGEQWLDLVRSFSGARDFWMANELTTDILCALGRTDDTSVLPALRHIRIEKPTEMNEPSWDALVSFTRSFITSRSLSDSPVQVNVQVFPCHIQGHICHAGFRQQEDLDSHLQDEHGYRMMCSHCTDFEWTHNDLFREHIDNEHPEVASKDALIWSPLLARSLPSQLESLLKKHSFLQAPDLVAPSTIVTALNS
jgi:hypothetical protein